MNILEKYSERWIQSLEKRQTWFPYWCVWCLLGLGAAFVFFGFVDKVWEYYLEGALAIGAAVVVFVVETCCRRIAELRRFLSEYRAADRNDGNRRIDLEENGPELSESE